MTATMAYKQYKSRFLEILDEWLCYALLMKEQCFGFSAVLQSPMCAPGPAVVCCLFLGLFGENGGSCAAPYITDPRNLLGLMVELIDCF